MFWLRSLGDKIVLRAIARLERAWDAVDTRSADYYARMGGTDDSTDD